MKLSNLFQVIEFTFEESGFGTDEKGRLFFYGLRKTYMEDETG